MMNKNHKSEYFRIINLNYEKSLSRSQNIDSLRNRSSNYQFFIIHDGRPKVPKVDFLLQKALNVTYSLDLDILRIYDLNRGEKVDGMSCFNVVHIGCYFTSILNLLCYQLIIDLHSRLWVIKTMFPLQF